MATNPGHATLCGRQPAGRAGSVGSPQRYGPGSRGAAPPPTPAPRPGCAACTGTGLGTKASNPPARQSLIPNPAVDGMPADPNLPPERVGVLTGGQLAHHLSPLLGGMRCIGGLPDQLIPKQSDRPRRAPRPPPPPLPPRPPPPPPRPPPPAAGAAASSGVAGEKPGLATTSAYPVICCTASEELTVGSPRSACGRSMTGSSSHTVGVAPNRVSTAATA